MRSLIEQGLPGDLQWKTWNFLLPPHLLLESVFTSHAALLPSLSSNGFYTAPRRKEKKIIIAKIDSMSHDGRGVAHVGGKALFVERAITGETVEVKVMKKKKTYLISSVAHLSNKYACSF